MSYVCSVGHVRMLLGQNLHKPKQLQGAIRRFNVEANDRFHWYCMSSESEGNEIAGRNVILPSFFQDNEKTTKTNLILEQILKRLAGLEANVTKWMEVRNLHDQKLRRYELNQKGCQVDGDTVIAVGQKYRNNTECTECICIALNEMNCRRISCATLECEHPVLPAGQCCPVCAKECFYNGRRWRSGQQYWPKNCVKCICDNGNMDCQFLGSSKCPKLDCDEQEIPPNQCCPVCVNIYSCEANLCDPNAICSNTNYGAKCRCKTGFFGNGTVCNDIDECAWDDIAREQLGGCLSGTVCLNLPGSFKCECLPGYQKLDDRTCMDVMRV
uniref:EGF-like domain-containing protein n=1 Tax=Setaria digitata TaxID=48799 RepID=A0A915PR93_9BILA